jgi:hypothetical protein
MLQNQAYCRARRLSANSPEAVGRRRWSLTMAHTASMPRAWAGSSPSPARAHSAAQLRPPALPPRQGWSRAPVDRPANEPLRAGGRCRPGRSRPGSFAPSGCPPRQKCTRGDAGRRGGHRGPG